MLPQKIDQQTANAIKSILQKLNINHARVLIDLEKQTVELQEEDYSIDDSQGSEKQRAEVENP